MYMCMSRTVTRDMCDCTVVFCFVVLLNEICKVLRLNEINGKGVFGCRANYNQTACPSCNQL